MKHLGIKLRRHANKQKFKAHYGVLIEWMGDKTQVLPLLEHIAGEPSDGSGSFFAFPLNDASWSGEHLHMSAIYARLRKACSLRFTWYVRLQLHHFVTEHGHAKRVLMYKRGKPPKFDAPKHRKNKK
jgi:hypothetical protein